MGAQDLSQIQDRNTQTNFCENSFYPAIIKNDNEAAAMIYFLCCTKGTNNSIKLKKDGIVEYNTF